MVFTDRSQELDLLLRTLNKSHCSFVVVYGRRRFGKSTLIKKALRETDVYFMADQTESVNQRRLLASAIADQLEGFDELARMLAA